MAAPTLAQIRRSVIRCRRCPRLVDYLEECRSSHRDYWARPVPGFGDPRARIAVVGLAPGYHGANRSGRPFWLDASGEWLYGELERRGLWDGEALYGVHILNAVKCVPPQNRPTGAEQSNCLGWLERELAALRDARLVLALGAIAHRAVLKAWEVRPLARHAFAHASLHRIEGRPPLLSSYHPSRQNTNTGVLTRRMWRSIFARAVELAAV
ncbi:MAG: uracil-DNA glycosylase [Proteobacteria bacterium]|nr:uracil-DNA glycosylase [Pseudomonadota bacterium]